MISLADAPSQTTDNVFVTDTTIFHVFERYFEANTIEGMPFDAYTFAGVLRDGFEPVTEAMSIYEDADGFFSWISVDAEDVIDEVTVTSAGSYKLSLGRFQLVK
jgi:hypothetical protein